MTNLGKNLKKMEYLNVSNCLTKYWRYEENNLEFNFDLFLTSLFLRNLKLKEKETSQILK